MIVSRKKKFLIIFVLLFVVVLIFSISSAYYQAILNGVETTTTITGQIGTMNVEYSGGNKIQANNIAPSTSLLLLKQLL